MRSRARETRGYAAKAEHTGNHKEVRGAVLSAGRFTTLTPRETLWVKSILPRPEIEPW